MSKVFKTFILVCAAQMTVFAAGCTGDASAQDDAAEPNNTSESVAKTEADSQPDQTVKKAKGAMSADSLAEIIKTFDEDAEVSGNAVQFSLLERDLIMVYDENADRMRIITPIAKAGLADSALMERMLQANYDAVLDVRYAMANDIIWVVYLHTLSTVTKDDFLSGIAQAVTAAETFGTSFTSGAMVFGGGDTSGIHEDLLRELQKAAEEDGETTGI